MEQPVIRQLLLVVQVELLVKVMRGVIMYRLVIILEAVAAGLAQLELMLRVRLKLGQAVRVRLVQYLALRSIMQVAAADRDTQELLSLLAVLAAVGQELRQELE